MSNFAGVDKICLGAQQSRLKMKHLEVNFLEIHFKVLRPWGRGIKAFVLGYLFDVILGSQRK